MKYLQNLLEALSKWFHPNADDNYVPIEVKAIVPETPEQPSISDNLRAIAESLNFGNKTEKYLEMAVRLHKYEVNQEKWLRSIHTLSNVSGNGRRWMLEKSLSLSELRPSY